MVATFTVSISFSHKIKKRCKKILDRFGSLGWYYRPMVDQSVVFEEKKNKSKFLNKYEIS